MLKNILFIICMFVIAGADEIKETSEENLWNHAIKMEKVIASVEYKGRQINVWHDDTHNRYYAFPLCVVEMSSMKCGINEFLNPSQHVLMFTIRLWDPLIKDVIKLKLKQQKRDFEDENVMALPMQMVRLDSRSGIAPNFVVDREWRSFQNQPSKITFEVFVKDEKYCQKLLNDSINDPVTFFTQTQLEFQFTVIAEQQTTRGINVTSQTVKKSKLFSKLNNFYKNLKNSTSTGSVYLNSKDIKNLARDLYNSASAQEEVSSEYVSTDAEESLLNKMIDKLYEEKIQSKVLMDEDYDSIFWDDSFARPDKLSHYLNTVYEYSDDDKKFHLDEQKEKEFQGNEVNDHSTSSSGSGGGSLGFSIFGIGANAGGEGASSNSEATHSQNETKKIDKNAFSTDDFKRLVKEKNLQVEWNGKVFIPKSMDLYRVNVNELSNKNKVFFNKIITKKLRSSQNAPLIPDFDALPDAVDPVSPVYYQELMEKYLALTTTLKPQINTIVGQLKNISQQVGINTSEMKKLKQQVAALQFP